MELAVVILAGGEGRRIGGGKPLRIVAGRTLIDRALERARSWSDLVAVSVRAPTQVGDLGTTPLLLDEEGNGPISGLAAALRFANQKGAPTVLTIPCDTPLLPPDLPDRLSATLDGVGAAMAESEGRLHPSCALWRSECLDALPGYLAADRSSLKGFAGHVGSRTAIWPAAPFDPFLNVNTTDDLAAVERLLRSR